jgi:ribosomal protein S18 acetylase RimI-like enzyme
MDNIVIRKCAETETEEIHHLETNWAAEDITYGFVPSLIEELNARLGDYFLVSENRKTIIGFIYGSIKKSEGLSVIPAKQTYLEIDSIYVIPEHRNKGIGGKLLDSLTEVARLNRIVKFKVFTATKEYDRIIKFYRSHGFQPWGTQLFK